jgi:hypothetical protein
MDFLFILDPLPALKAYKDSSVAMMRAATRSTPASPATCGGTPPAPRRARCR